MKFMIKCALALVPSLALATPGFAQQTDLLSNSRTPGSVIVFPKFTGGAATAVHVDGATLPRTEIEIGAVCPDGATCTEHQSVQVHFTWVCPGTQAAASKFVCPAVDFQVVLSINGKLAFSADGTPINSNSPTVPGPPCKNGYLIGWVINAGQPIKFDGLIGDAVLRGPNNAVSTPSVNAGFSTAVSAYKGVTIQADPALATGDLIKTNNGNLVFDGGPGHYKALTGKLFGDVKFDNATARTTDPTPGNALSQTFLILLTIDTIINRSNDPVFVPIDFYNESLSTVSTTNPNFERITSTSWEFLCWTQVQLTKIDANLTQAFQGTRKGTVIAGPAEKVPFIGINDQPFNCPDFTSAGCDPRVTLLGLVHTVEGTAANNYQERSYIYEMYNDLTARFTCFRESGRGCFGG